MVDISDILRNVCDKMPAVIIGLKEYPVQFFEGVLDDAKEQMNTYKKANKMPYPAVWLIRDFKQDDNVINSAITQLQLVVLIDTKNSYQAPERLQTTINPYLMPLKDRLIKGLQRSGVYVQKPYEVIKLTYLGSSNASISANNSKGNSRLFADYLDAIKITLNVTYSPDLKLTCYES